MKISFSCYLVFFLCFTQLSLPVYGQSILDSCAFKSTNETKIICDDKAVVIDTVLFHFQTKPWNTQPGLQNLLVYHYQLDTVRIKEVLQNEGTYDFILKNRWKRKYRKKRNFLFLTNKTERTGYILNPVYFYLHPIRGDMYDKIFWTPHPYVEFKAFDTDIDTFYNNLWIPQLGTVEMKYITKKDYVTDEFNTNGRQVLKIIARSKIKKEKYDKIKNKRFFDEDQNNVQLTTIFSKERGFEFYEYIFPSGVRIEHNLISIEFEK